MGQIMKFTTIHRKGGFNKIFRSTSTNRYLVHTESVSFDTFLSFLQLCIAFAMLSELFLCITCIFFLICQILLSIHFYVVYYSLFFHHYRSFFFYVLIIFFILSCFLFLLYQFIVCSFYNKLPLLYFVFLSTHAFNNNSY